MQEGRETNQLWRPLPWWLFTSNDTSNASFKNHGTTSRSHLGADSHLGILDKKYDKNNAILYNFHYMCHHLLVFISPICLKCRGNPSDRPQIYYIGGCSRRIQTWHSNAWHWPTESSFSCVLAWPPSPATHQLWQETANLSSIYLLPVTEQQANNIKTDLELQIRIISIMLIQNQHADDVDSDHMGACDKDYVPETFQ